MSTITATSGQPIRVGRKLDNKAVSVTFDLETLCTEYSPEEVKLAVKRDGDDTAYYASGWTMDGSTGTWIPTSVDLARPSCLVQPILFAADDVVAHGEVFRCVISRSIDDETGDIPAAQSLLIEIGRVSDKADTAISTATDAKQISINAMQLAGTASTGAQAANNKADHALSQIEEINDRLAVDEDSIIVNEHKLIYGSSRYDLPCARSAAYGGYTLSGYAQDSFEAILEAKRRGFDMVELATSRTGDGHCLLSRDGKVIVNNVTVDSYRVALDNITNPVLLSTYIRFCGKIGIGILLDFTTGKHNEASITEAINLLRTRRVPYIVYSSSVGVFPIARGADPTCEILYQAGEYPTIEKVSTDSKYENIRTAAAQAGGGCVAIQVSGSQQITADYADGLAALGIGLTGARLEVLESRRANADFYTIHIGQYRTADIYTALS